MLPKSGLGQACSYLLGHWTPLTAHLRHSQTRLDTNSVENAIRPSKLGAKNWLFIGHPEVGDRAAVIYSLVISCQRHGHNPHDYLRAVLGRLPAMTTVDAADDSSIVASVFTGNPHQKLSSLRPVNEAHSQRRLLQSGRQKEIQVSISGGWSQQLLDGYRRLHAWIRTTAPQLKSIVPDGDPAMPNPAPDRRLNPRSNCRI